MAKMKFFREFRVILQRSPAGRLRWQLPKSPKPKGFGVSFLDVANMLEVVTAEIQWNYNQIILRKRKLMA
jgi:hypothetical protein